MANSEILGLFGTSPQQLRNEYRDSNMVSPAQMGSQGLLQQVVSMGGNAGSILGAGIGGLLGGAAPGEAEASFVNNALAEVNKMGIEDPAEKMAKVGELLSANPATAKQGMIAMREATKLKMQGYEMNQMQRAEEEAARASEVAAKEAQRKAVLVTEIVKRNPELPPVFAEVIADDPKALMDLLNPKVKTTFKTVGGRVGMYNSETGDLIKDIGAEGDSDVTKLAGSVGQLAASMAAAQAKKAAEAGGADVGKQVAQANAGLKSLNYLSDALDIVNEGIYTGGYGPMQEALSKYSKGVLGSNERLANTEAFRAYIGNVVIPMMSQLGGSDSNEELKKMEKIAAGDTTLEESAIKRILRNAKTAVQNDLAFLEKQQNAILNNEPLPTRRSKATEGVTASCTSYTIKD